MKKVENVYIDQSRWNNVYGKKSLTDIQENPKKFIIDSLKLSKIKQDVIALMPDIKNKQILELGSGRGEFSVALAKLGGSVTGIDTGEYLIELSKKTAELNKVKCDFFAGSITKLPFEESTFDFVVGNAILHHLPKKGVVESVTEAYRVLKPGGMAFFTECIENSKLFDLLQNLFPIGKPNTPQYRPSVLQQARFKKHMEEADDRALSNIELTNAKGSFRQIEFRYHGLLIRLMRLFSNPQLRVILNRIDFFLTHKYSPIKKLSQQVLVIYSK